MMNMEDDTDTDLTRRAQELSIPPEILKISSELDKDGSFADELIANLQLLSEPKRKETLPCAVPLIRENDTLVDRLFIIDVIGQFIEKVPDESERNEIMSHTLSFITNNMGTTSIALALKDIQGIKSHLRSKVTDYACSLSMTDQDRLNVLEAIKEISEMHPDSESEAQSEAQLESVMSCCQIKGLIEDDMNGKDIASIIKKVNSIPEADRADVVKGAVKLITKSMNISERLQIIEGLKSIPKDREESASHALSLIEGLNIQGALRIIQNISGTLKEKRAEVASCSSSLITKDTSVKERITVLALLEYFMPTGQGDQIMPQTHQVITPDMAAVTKATIFCALAEVSQEQRLSVVKAYNSLKKFDWPNIKEVILILKNLITQNINLEERVTAFSERLELDLKTHYALQHDKDRLSFHMLQLLKNPHAPFHLTTDDALEGPQNNTA